MQDQWQQKKKSKQESKDNKRNKLDPENNGEETMTAKEVMDQKAKTGKPVRLPGAPISQEKQQEPELANEPEQQSEQDKIDSEELDVEIPDMDVDVGDDSEQDVSKEDSIQVVFDDEGNETNGTTVNSKEILTDKTESSGEIKSKKVLSETEKQQKQENLRKLREKLASKISNLREKRKAPGTKATGAPKSREQILEERKRKAEAKRQEKLKRKHDEVSSESEDESELEPEAENQVVFGNITFNDGTRVTSDLNKIRNTSDKKKAKGPSNNDIKAHLARLERKKQKLSSLTPEQQAKELEKEKWNRLMNQAEGIKVKDDEKLLKKALKRKEKQKLKSEIEWKDRKRIVQDTIAAKAKKREENLKLRKENKGKKWKLQVRLKKFLGIVNKKGAAKKRAGFEGSAKLKKK